MKKIRGAGVKNGAMDFLFNQFWEFVKGFVRRG
jgi:hypothetical protein